MRALPSSLGYKVPADTFALYPAAYQTLSRYDAVTSAIYSNGSGGGYDLSVRQGLGAWPDVTSDYLGWLGRAFGPGYEVPDAPGVYRRDFEHGVALYSLRGGTVASNPPFLALLLLPFRQLP